MKVQRLLGQGLVSVFLLLAGWGPGLRGAEPEPLTLAKPTTNSFTLLIGMTHLRALLSEETFACPKHRSGTVPRTGRNADTRPRP